jgi:alanine dehydrogenase
MKIGVPKEIKDHENRVALTPDGAARLVRAGHSVHVQVGAGLGSGFPDAAYSEAGARPCDAADAWNADLVVKVKEPMAPEYDFLKHQMLFTFLHLAGVPRALTEALLAGKTTAIAYETLEDAAGRLPLLEPMSAVAGNMATLMGAYYLGRPHGGNGMQLGEVLGRKYGKVLIVGDGIVAFHAAKTAHGLGAEVFVAGLDPAKGAAMREAIGADLNFFPSTPATIAGHLPDTDLLVGGVLQRGAKAARVVTEAMVKSMRPGSVLVDVSIDQGGCIETSHATTHSDPVYERHGVLHYCVANMPSAYPRTSTLALTEASLPYIVALAERGIGLLREDAGFGKALNAHGGFLTNKEAADSMGLTDRYRAFSSLSTERLPIAP